MSVNIVTNNNGTAVFTKNKVAIYKESEMILTGQKENGLYTINLKENITKYKSLLSNERKRDQH